MVISDVTIVVFVVGAKVVDEFVSLFVLLSDPELVGIPDVATVVFWSIGVTIVGEKLENVLVITVSIVVIGENNILLSELSLKLLWYPRAYSIKRCLKIIPKNKKNLI